MKNVDKINMGREECLSRKDADLSLCWLAFARLAVLSHPASTSRLSHLGPSLFRPVREASKHSLQVLGLVYGHFEQICTMTKGEVIFNLKCPTFPVRLMKLKWNETTTIWRLGLVELGNLPHVNMLPTPIQTVCYAPL